MNDETELETALLGLLDCCELDADITIESARSFRDAGLGSGNRGIVIRLSNGAVFQLTVVQASRAS